MMIKEILLKKYMESRRNIQNCWSYSKLVRPTDGGLRRFTPTSDYIDSLPTDCNALSDAIESGGLE